jgi:hypothetical protein
MIRKPKPSNSVSSVGKNSSTGKTPNFGDETFEYWSKHLDRLGITLEQLKSIHEAPIVLRKDSHDS